MEKQRKALDRHFTMLPSQREAKTTVEKTMTASHAGCQSQSTCNVQAHAEAVGCGQRAKKEKGKQATAPQTTRGTPTSAGLHTSVQVLSKENEIWLINNK